MRPLKFSVRNLILNNFYLRHFLYFWQHCTMCLIMMLTLIWSFNFGALYTKNEKLDGPSFKCMNCRVILPLQNERTMKSVCHDHTEYHHSKDAKIGYYSLAAWCRVIRNTSYLPCRSRYHFAGGVLLWYAVVNRFF